MISPTKYLLKHLLKKKCPYSISRSGEEGQAVNCFNVYLYTSEKPYMVITDIFETELHGKLWSIEGFGEIETIKLTSLKDFEIRITHHYGLYDTKYIGLWDYFLTGYTKINQFKCAIHRWSEDTKQYFYNRKQLATFDRIEILRAIVQMKMTGHGEHFMAMDILTNLYSMRWVLHPDSDIHETRIQLFVDSFLESGELASAGGAYYTVTGKAINTLSKYEEQERRHHENKSLQNRMLFLTFALVAVGLLQAIVSWLKN